MHDDDNTAELTSVDGLKAYVRTCGTAVEAWNHEQMVLSAPIEELPMCAHDVLLQGGDGTLEYWAWLRHTYVEFTRR